MKIGFTGHRNKRTSVAHLEALLLQYPDDEWVHGGAEGFDTQVDEFAKAHGKTPIVIRPDYYRYRATPKLAPLKRNEKIVDVVQLLVACYDGRRGGGTRYTLDYAEAQAVPIQYVDCHPLQQPAMP